MSGFRLASYNIHGGVGWDGRYDLGRTLTVLNEIEADVIALQEVSVQAPDGTPMLDRLASGTGLTAIPGPVTERRGSPYGNAVLTRFPTAAVRGVDLSVPGHEPRGALDIELTMNRSAFRLVSTHLGLSPWERRIQGRRLLRLFAEEFRHPSALVGDLNGWFLWGGPLTRLRRRFDGGPAPLTFPVSRPMIALDRIWIHPPSALVSLQAHTSTAARLASDHFPLVAEVRIH